MSGPEIRRALVETEDGVRRATLDVSVAGDSALVSLAMEAGRTRVVCSCGGAPACRHARVACGWLEGQRRSEPPPRRIASSVAPPPLQSAGDAQGGRPPGGETLRPPSGGTRAELLGAALDDLVTTVVRAGVRGAVGAPSFEEALRRIVNTAPAPTPASLGRTLGRLVEALGAGDVGLVARLCHGLARFADALRAEHALETQAWLGVAGAGLLAPALGRDPLDGSQPDPSAHLVDVRLVEVAREWVATLDRSGLERRYLVAPALGRLYREERLRGQGTPSLGPCPRALDVALAEVEPGPTPQRIRLLQYEVALLDAPEGLSGVVALGNQVFPDFVHDLAGELGAHPALAEPFALLAPRAVERTRVGVVLVDTAGQHLPLAADTAGTGELLLDLSREAAPALVCGRVVVDRGTVAFSPLTAVVKTGATLRLRRLV
jgi:hypothetical protein